MHTRLKILKSLALVSLVAPLMLLAAEEEGRQVVAGSRADVPVAEVPEEEAREEASCGYIFDRYPSTYLSTATCWFIRVSALDNTCTLNDGTVLTFSSYDAQKALQWINPTPDVAPNLKVVIPLTIIRNLSWFSSYKYRIVNQTTGESIPVNLKLGPVDGNEYARFIAAIDPGNRIIVLNNGEKYEISSNSQSEFSKWASYDSIVKGQDGGWGSSYDILLINVNMDNYAFARRI